MTPEMHLEKALLGDYGEQNRANAESAIADAAVHGYEADAERIAETFEAQGARAPIAVLLSSTYACGRSTERTVQVAAPAEDADIDDWLSGVLADLGGDGHPCGSVENALYDVTVIDAPQHHALIGRRQESQG